MSWAALADLLKRSVIKITIIVWIYISWIFRSIDVKTVLINYNRIILYWDISFCKYIHGRWRTWIFCWGESSKLSWLLQFIIKNDNADKILFYYYVSEYDDKNDFIDWIFNNFGWLFIFETVYYLIIHFVSLGIFFLLFICFTFSILKDNWYKLDESSILLWLLRFFTLFLFFDVNNIVL